LPEVISLTKSYKNEFDKKIPTITAEGTYIGTDIYKYIQLGTQGVIWLPGVWSLSM